MSLKRNIRTVVPLLYLFFFFLIILIWSAVNYRVHRVRVTDFVRLPQTLRECVNTRSERSSPVEVDVKENKVSLNVNNMDLMLKGTLKTRIKEKHELKNSMNPTTTTKPTTKQGIDIVNDYYPFVDFKFVFPQISPRVETTPNIFMMVLVNSGANGDQYRKRREAIRQTWGNQSNCEQRKALGDERLKNLRWLLVFVVGKAGPGTNNDELNMAEARQHNDMLIGNITDNYINNVVKFYMGQVWASKFDVKYTLKTDDDVYVRIPRVLEYLYNAKFPRPFYGGWTNPSGTPVHRVIGSKWTISWKYFGEVNYPKYNAGAYFILSTDLLDRLFNYVYIRKPFHIDDAYVGIAMRDYGVKISTIVSFSILNDTNRFSRSAKDCEILRLHGFADNMNPESTTFLHNRLKILACGNVTIKC